MILKEDADKGKDTDSKGIVPVTIALPHTPVGNSRD